MGNVPFSETEVAIVTMWLALDTDAAHVGAVLLEETVTVMSQAVFE